MVGVDATGSTTDNIDPLSLIIGFVVAMVLVVVIATAIVVIVIVVMKKRQGKEPQFNSGGDSTELSNRNYEEGECVSACVWLYISILYCNL